MLPLRNAVKHIKMEHLHILKKHICLEKVVLVKEMPVVFSPFCSLVLEQRRVGHRCRSCSCKDVHLLSYTGAKIQHVWSCEAQAFCDTYSQSFCAPRSPAFTWQLDWEGLGHASVTSLCPLQAYFFLCLQHQSLRSWYPHPKLLTHSKYVECLPHA